MMIISTGILDVILKGHVKKEPNGAVVEHQSLIQKKQNQNSGLATEDQGIIRKEKK